MSVRYQKKTRLNLSVRDNLQTNLHLQQNILNCQFINCNGNKIQFHKKLIQTYSLHLVCKCIGKSIKQQNKQRHQDSQYSLQIQGINMYITKSQVKHNFTIQKYVNQAVQILRLQTSENQIFIIESCNISSVKNGLKLMIINDQQKLTKNQNNVTKIKPIQLIQENIRLRTLKLGKTFIKTVQINQSTKKLNFNLNWNRQSVASPIQSPTFSDLKPQRQMRKGSVCNLTKNEIKGVEYKKSIQKIPSQRLRSFSKAQKNLGNKAIGPVNPLKKVIQTHKLASSVSSKNFKKDQDINRKILANKNYFEENEVDISSQSFYSAKKQIKNQFQGNQRKQNNKLVQTESKENFVYPNSSFAVKPKIRQTNTQDKSLRQSEANLKTSLGYNGFGKNISQAKIAQVSRTLLSSKKNLK